MQCTCEFCSIHQLDSPDNPFGVYVWQIYLGYESEIDLIQVCDLKRRPFFSEMRNWSPIFGHINTTFLQLTDDVLFCCGSNCEDCKGEVVNLLFIWTDLNKIANLINKRGINCNYESILTIDSFITSTHQAYDNKAKTFFKMAHIDGERA